MKKKAIWYVILVLLCCGAVLAVQQAVDTQKPAKQAERHTFTGATPSQDVPVAKAKPVAKPSVIEKEIKLSEINPNAPATMRDADATGPTALVRPETDQAAKDQALAEYMANMPRPVTSLDQGGEDCANATVIASLPYAANGTTIGYADHYDAVCPYGPATSPDVVYVYTAGTTIEVDISLCTDPGNGTSTDYDSKLFVFENTCGGTFYACNDDACNTPNYPSSYVSRIPSVFFNAGNTYYIVVDGYGGGSGNYYLTIDPAQPWTPVLPCPEGSLYDSPPMNTDESWSFGVSDLRDPSEPTYEGLIRFEEYTVMGSICDIHWYGLSLACCWSACDEDPMTFEIKFYPDAAGYPDMANPTCTYTVSPNRVSTGILYAGVYEAFRWDAVLAPCCNLNSGWVSIQAISTGAPDCWFLWASAHYGDGGSWMYDQGALSWTWDAYDLAFCLTGQIDEAYGACCYPSTWTCADNVLNMDCWAAGGVFYEDQLCADIYCGPPFGRCCYGPDPLNPLCAENIEADCDILGGDWTLGLTCATACPTPCVVECPGGGIPEGETCPEDINGGCNITPPALSPIACGQTVCGTVWADVSTRDTDWYEIVLTTPTLVTMTFEAEFYGIAGFIVFPVGIDGSNPNACDYVSSIDPYTLVDSCVVGQTSKCLPAGTWWLFVSAADWYDIACRDYTLAISCEPCELPQGACCYGDPFAPTCGDMDEYACYNLGGTWNAGLTCATYTCPTPPANDYCEDAIALPVPASVVGTTINSTIDAAPLCVTGITTGGVWYKVVGTGHTMTATTCNLFTPYYDTKLCVYCGSCEDLVCVGGNDDNCSGGSSGLLSTVTWCAQAGAEYYILVHGFSTATGDFQLDILDDGVPCEPTVLCICPAVDDVTAYKLPASGIEVRFTADEPGLYVIWSTTNPNNDGNPDNGGDLDFTAESSFPIVTPQVVNWIDGSALVAYKNYVVTWECGVLGRCCYGEDPENPLCADVPLAICDYLEGTWVAGLNCTDNPCPSGTFCPPGGIDEGEPDCADEYVDVTNGGCNSAAPYPFGTVNCGETLCGTSGNFLFAGSQYRDTDWFRLVLTEAQQLTWSVTAEFDVLIFIINAGTENCSDYAILGSATAAAGGTATYSAYAPAGVYWLWVGPSVFTGWPCGSRWYGTVTCDEPPPPPPGDNCADPVIISAVPYTNSSTTSGAYHDFAGSCVYDGGAPDHIYQFTPSTTGTYLVSLCGSSFDTGLYIRTGGACPGDTEIACNDDACGVQSEITTTLTSGVTYWIIVDGYNTASGEYVLNVLIPGGPVFTFDGNTCGAGNDCVYRTSEDSQVMVTIPTTGYWRFSLCPGYGWDTYMYLSSVNDCSSYLYYNDDACGATSEFSVPSLPAGTYYVDIEAYSASCGQWTLNVFDY